jgi:hypothetical protein
MDIRPPVMTAALFKEYVEHMCRSIKDQAAKESWDIASTAAALATAEERTRDVLTKLGYKCPPRPRRKKGKV